MQESEAVNIVLGNELFDYETLRDSLQKERNKHGKKVVFTAGVWDLLHEGHVRYLRHAKECGDILIVGVDTDVWTRERKGPNRPLVLEDERVELLRELRSVDHVVFIGSFHDYEECIEILHPDILVISSSTNDFPEGRKQKYLQYCEELKIFEPQSATSTSSRLRNMMIDGGRALAIKIQNLINEHLSGGGE